MTQCQNLIVIQGLIYIGLVILYNDQHWWLNQGICGQVPKFTAALPKITPLLVIKSTTVRLDHEGHTIIFQTSETSTLGDVAEKTISRQSLEPQWNQSHYIQVAFFSLPKKCAENYPEKDILKLRSVQSQLTLTALQCPRAGKFKIQSLGQNTAHFVGNGNNTNIFPRKSDLQIDFQIYFAFSPNSSPNLLIIMFMFFRISQLK